MWGITNMPSETHVVVGVLKVDPEIAFSVCLRLGSAKHKAGFQAFDDRFQRASALPEVADD